MIKIVDEYDVTYAVKEWLISKQWNIVAFNPPGAQGTFTIPNPKKSTGYRGQTGSLSPDLIAVKNSEYVIVVESKPSFNTGDAGKLLKLFNDSSRVKIFLDIVEKVCKANNIPFSKTKCKLVLAKAHGGSINLKPNIETFHVSVQQSWNSKLIDTSLNPLSFMQVNYYPSNKPIGKVVTT